MLTDVPPLLLWAAPVFALLMLVEAVESARDDEFSYRDLRDTGASLSMGLGYLLITTLFWTAASVAALTALYQFRLFELGWSAWAWAAAMLADDFVYYCFHRAHHEVRVLWASHVVHHSSRRYNLGTALRQTWTPFTNTVFWLPLPLLGVHPLMVVTLISVSMLYQFWLHTERVGRLPRPLELVLNTPSHHRVHHGSNARYLDKNYGGILIVWDRLFGTFEPETEPVVYGLTKNVASYNPLVIAFHEFRDLGRELRQQDLSWRERLSLALRGPGWSPAG